MNKILILFTHPLFEKSRIQKALVSAIPSNENITFHDLYEEYPDFNINVIREQKLLLEHNIIIWQHPLYWYSIPPLLKQWIDMVLQFGWAYGTSGDALTGKYIFNVISSGGSEEVYSSTGRNRYTIQQFLYPLERTVALCHMNYLPPFLIHGTHKLNDTDIKEKAKSYNALLKYLLDQIPDESKLKSIKYMNEILS